MRLAYASRMWLRSRCSLTSARVTVTGKRPAGTTRCGLFRGCKNTNGSHATNLPDGRQRDPQFTTQVNISPRSVIAVFSCCPADHDGLFGQVISESLRFELPASQLGQPSPAPTASLRAKRKLIFGVHVQDANRCP